MKGLKGLEAPGGHLGAWGPSGRPCGATSKRPRSRPRQWSSLDGGHGWGPSSSACCLPRSGKAGVYFYVSLYKSAISEPDPAKEAETRVRTRRDGVQWTGQVSLTEALVSKSWFPCHRQSNPTWQGCCFRQVTKNVWTGTHVVSKGKRANSSVGSPPHQHLFFELRTNWLSLLPREHSPRSRLVRPSSSRTVPWPAQGRQGRHPRAPFLGRHLIPQPWSGRLNKC